MVNKKKILFLSDACHINTGFGGVSKRLLTSWYESRKYEILHICQGIQEGNPDLNRFPWKSIGSIPNDPSVIQRMNSDQFFARNVSYGDITLEKHVLDFKPQIVIVQQDPWGGSDIGQKYKFWNKTNCISWITYDSLPLYQPSLDHIDKLKNLYCWSTFAEEEFHRLGHKHVKTQFPPINTGDYYPLDKETKTKLKQQFGISDKKFIVNYTFRNQLRKLSKSIISGYSILLKQYPKIADDVYLHFHTHIKEGWDHKRFCKELGVDYSRILFTWICRNCRNIEIKSDNGDINCKYCKSESSQDTCNVGFGASVEQMNQLYNVADCFTLVANSGATELPGIEAMSCGLPLATIDYAYGHDFVKNDFVYKIKHSEYLEFGTQFIKASPNSEDICEFIKYIYELSVEKRLEIGKKSRQWIIDNFDTEVVSKKWQNIIDNLPEVTWDFQYEKEELKDPHAQISNNPNDLEWTLELYQKILKVNPKPDDDGVASWVQRLKAGQPRSEIELFFRNTATSDNQKLQSNQQQSIESLLDKNDKFRVLLILKESLGDHYILTSLLPEISKKYPNSSIYISCDPKYNEIYDGNQYIKKCLPWIPDFENELLITKVNKHNGLFDVSINVAISTQKMLNYLSNSY